jgi:PPOX class probable F420-dependent enzyme
MTTSSSDPVPFADSVRALLDGKNFAGVAPLGPDGAPQNSVVWIKRDGDTVLFSSTDGRQKVRKLRRDPRIGLSVFDLADPYTSVEIRGTAETSLTRASGSRTSSRTSTSASTRPVRRTMRSA